MGTNGAVLGLPFPYLRSSANYSHSRRYTRVQSCMNGIWLRWLSEYDPTLNERVKWHAPSEDTMKTGDLV